MVTATDNTPQTDSGTSVQALFNAVLDGLDAELRAQVLHSVKPAESALEATCTRYDEELDDYDQELQLAVQEFETAQAKLNALESEQADADAIEKAREESKQASTSMEAHMAKRAEKAAEYDKVKAEAAKALHDAQCDAIRKSGTPAQQQKLDEMAPTAAEASPMPSSASASSAAVSPSLSSEALQANHVDLIIRIGGKFSQLGIKIDANGTVTSAPGGLFDTDYTVLGIDGRRFKPGLEETAGTHNIILRCKKNDVLTSLERAPPKLVKGKALKLMQIKIMPGAQGFGIDLSEVNTVAGLVKAGKAEAADMRLGDIIVAVDGVNLGAKKLVEVLKKGKSSYIFTVIRPAAPSKQDKVNELTDSVDTPDVSDNGVAAKHVPASSSSVESAPTAAPREVALDEDDPLKRSLAESLGRLQKSTEMLAGPSVRITSTKPADGTGITVEWMPRSDGPKASHYHLQWKLAQDAEWTHSDASQAIKATLVTKGNLKKDGLYQFRVRACSEQSGEWGVWSTPSVPMSPDAIDDTLSTIQEESTVVSSVAPSVPGSRAGGQGSGVAMVVVQGMLADQRQALEKQAAEAYKAMEERLTGDLEAARNEAKLWKDKFTEAAGKSMQAVLDAKEDTRIEVLKEVEAEMKASEAMKEEAADAVMHIREAQKKAEDAKAEMEEYKARFEKVKAEAKAETDREAETKLQEVMRNAAMEIRDKVKAVESMTEGHIKRAVAEAVRIEQAKAEVVQRDLKRELTESYEARLQAMQNLVGQSSSMKIVEYKEQQDDRVVQAVERATAEVREEAKKAEARAVSIAVAQAIEETEARMIARQKLFESQMAAQKRATEEQRASMLTEEMVAMRIKRARQDAIKDKDKEVREAVERAEQKAVNERERLLEGVAEKIRTAVRDREKQLLADHGVGLQQLAEDELREANKLVRHAGKTASEQFGDGNDEFEENVLQATRPATLLDGDDLMNVPTKKPYRPPTQDELAAQTSQTAARGKASKKTDGDEDMVAPPLEYIRMKARHEMELKALMARQEADEYYEAESMESEPGSKRAAHAKRQAEKEGLRERQLKEAMSVGAALAYEEKARKAMDNQLDPLQHSDALALLRGDADDRIEELSSAHPALKAALEKVQSLEDKVRALGGMTSEDSALEMDRGENKKQAEQISQIIKQGESVGIAEAERDGIKDVMEVLRRHLKRGKVMQKMLDDVDNSADRAAQERADQVQHDIEREEDIIGALADRLQVLVTRDSDATLTKDETKLLRQLTEELKHQQEQAEMREAQIAWLKAESKRARITAVFEARAELEKMHDEAVALDSLELPTRPIAAAEDAFSISVDWLPPESGLAARFHLQWRIAGESKWTSSAASEQIKVPCCTKGHLRTGEAYEFRVRAANDAGVWGAWSKPSEPAEPNVLLSSMPTRPQVLAKTKGRIEVCWQPPEGGKIASYELQWRHVDGRWGEPGNSLETSDEVVTTPALSLSEYYTFRVRASLSRFRGNQYTEFSPSSPPVHPVKDPNAPRKQPKPAKSNSKKSKQPAYDPDASETVIMGELATAAKSFHPTAQAHVEAHLAELRGKREQDAANVQKLETRSSDISAKVREEKLNELVKIKRDVLSRSEPSNGTDAFDAALARNKMTNSTDSWD